MSEIIRIPDGTVVVVFKNKALRNKGEQLGSKRGVVEAFLEPGRDYPAKNDHPAVKSSTRDRYLVRLTLQKVVRGKTQGYIKWVTPHAGQVAEAAAVDARSAGQVSQAQTTPPAPAPAKRKGVKGAKAAAKKAAPKAAPKTTSAGLKKGQRVMKGEVVTDKQLVQQSAPKAST